MSYFSELDIERQNAERENDFALEQDLSSMARVDRAIERSLETFEDIKRIVQGA